MERTAPDNPNPRAAATPSRPSKLEWLPVAVLAVLAVVYFHMAPEGTTLSRLSWFVGLGLLPGTLWRLSGRPSWSVHRVCFAVALVFFVMDNPKLRPDGDTLGKMAANWPLVVLGAAVSFSQSLWGALRTHRLLADSGISAGFSGVLRLNLSGSFFNMFLPGSTGGDAYRVFALTRSQGAGLGPAIASITLDRFLGLPSLILVVAAGMFLDYGFFRANSVLSGLLPFIGVAAVVCLALVAYLALAGVSHRGKVRNAGDGRPAPGGWFHRLHAMAATNVKRPATLPLALLYGFLSHIACVASCLFFGLALGVGGVPALRYFLVVPMAMAINAVPGAPGGVGQGELAMASLLDMAGPGHGNLQAGVMVMLLFRLTNIVVGIVGGAAYATGKIEYAPARPEEADAWR